VTLPVLLSVPHAGLRIPPEVKDLCVLRPADVARDGDEGAGEIYGPLEDRVAGFVKADAARAVVDVNRRPDDRRRDGVVKTHTCWDVPVYREAPAEGIVDVLIEKYYEPYHSALFRLAKGVVLGVDCHTMAAKGPPVGPDPGLDRPPICLGNADGTCPKEWIQSLAVCFSHCFELPVSINKPFRGGYIVRRHATEVPWVQLELNRAPFMSNREKSERVLASLTEWFDRNPSMG